jgi:hypothetical protein
LKEDVDQLTKKRTALKRSSIKFSCSMQAFFKTFYPTLDELLKHPQFKQTREEVWQELQDLDLPIDYQYFLTEIAGERPKFPTFSLSDVLGKPFRSRGITIQRFVRWNELDSSYPMGYVDMGEGGLVVAEVQEGGVLLFCGQKGGGIYYQNRDNELLRIADNLLAFLQKCIKRTPWTQEMLVQILKRNGIGQGNIVYENFENFPKINAYKEVVCLQHYQGQIDYLVTKSAIVFFGEQTREYWLEELEEINFSKQDYLKLAVNQIDHLYMTLDFGYRQERLICRQLHEQRVINDLLKFILQANKRYK